MFCLLAFVGAALAGYGFSSLAAAALADIMVTGIAYSAYSTYQQGVAQKETNEANAKIAANQAAAQEAQAQEYERQAALEKDQAGIAQIQGEQEAAKRARARASEVGSTYAAAAGNGLLVSGSETDTFANVLKSQEQEAQAQEYERQAALEKDQAGIAQIQGEQEAAKRARARASEVGSTYAAAAGNGLLVSGSETDTFANVLKSQEQEAQADIQTIKANTALNVWSREEQARSYLVAAQQSRYGVTSSLLSSSNYSKQAKYAYSSGVTSAAGSALSGIGSAAVGVNGLAKETGGYQWGGK